MVVFATASPTSKYLRNLVPPTLGEACDDSVTFWPPPPQRLFASKQQLGRRGPQAALLLPPRDTPQTPQGLTLRWNYPTTEPGHRRSTHGQHPLPARLAGRP